MHCIMRGLVLTSSPILLLLSFRNMNGRVPPAQRDGLTVVSMPLLIRRLSLSVVLTKRFNEACLPAHLAGDIGTLPVGRSQFTDINP